MRPKCIELEIEELVLHGFAPADRYRLAETVERELTRLFMEQSVPAALMASGQFERLEGGTFQVTPGGKPEVVGAQIAQTIYRGLGRQGEP